MSRLGRTPVKIPSGVDLSTTGRHVLVKGPKGSLEWDLPEGISVEVDGGMAVVKAAEDGRRLRPFHGLSRALVKNMVIGVSEGYERRLALAGVGYLAQHKGNVLELTVGRANVEKIEIPANVEIEVAGRGLLIVVRGCDKQAVGELAARIRKVHPPEPYKGKGIRYDDEVVRRKQGKTLVGGK